MSRRRNKSTKRRPSDTVEQSRKDWGWRRFVGIWLFAAIVLLITAIWKIPTPHWSIAVFVILGATAIAAIEAAWPGRSGF